MKEATFSGIITNLALSTGSGASLVVEGVTGVLLVLIAYHYMHLLTGDGDREQEHRRWLLQSFAALGGLLYFSSLFAPSLDAWPIQLATAAQTQIGATADEIATILARDDLAAQIFKIGFVVYVLVATTAAVAIRIPILLWQSLTDAL